LLSYHLLDFNPKSSPFGELYGILHLYTSFEAYLVITKPPFLFTTIQQTLVFFMVDQPSIVTAIVIVGNGSSFLLIFL